MSAVAVIAGQVRQVRENRRKTEPGTAPGEVWGRSATILTEVGGELGDSIRVTVFNKDRDLELVPGALVLWVVELQADKYGQGAVFKALLDPQLVAAWRWQR